MIKEKLIIGGRKRNIYTGSKGGKYYMKDGKKRYINNKMKGGSNAPLSTMPKNISESDINNFIVEIEPLLKVSLDEFKNIETQKNEFREQCQNILTSPLITRLIEAMINVIRIKPRTTYIHKVYKTLYNRILKGSISDLHEKLEELEELKKNNIDKKVLIIKLHSILKESGNNLLLKAHIRRLLEFYEESYILKENTTSLKKKSNTNKIIISSSTYTYNELNEKLINILNELAINLENNKTNNKNGEKIQEFFSILKTILLKQNIPLIFLHLLNKRLLEFKYIIKFERLINNLDLIIDELFKYYKINDALKVNNNLLLKHFYISILTSILENNKINLLDIENEKVGREYSTLKKLKELKNTLLNSSSKPMSIALQEKCKHIIEKIMNGPESQPFRVFIYVCKICKKEFSKENYEEQEAKKKQQCDHNFNLTKPFTYTVDGNDIISYKCKKCKGVFNEK